jgi:AbrB family looped-hinge helix DNA binding protein
MAARSKVSGPERFRGMFGTQGRIQIPKPIRTKLDIKPGTFYEASIYGERSDKILIEIIK